MNQVIHITPEQGFSLVDQPDEPLGLTKLQGLVDGYVERIPTVDFDVWVNEDGYRRDDFLPNQAAMRLLSEAGLDGYWIVGPVVLTGATDDAEVYPLEADVRDRLVAHLVKTGFRTAREA